MRDEFRDLCGHRRLAWLQWGEVKITRFVACPIRRLSGLGTCNNAFSRICAASMTDFRKKMINTNKLNKLQFLD